MIKRSPIFSDEGCPAGVPRLPEQQARKVTGAQCSYPQGEHMAKEVIVYSNVG
jgi:hypothetical protein